MWRGRLRTALRRRRYQGGVIDRRAAHMGRAVPGLPLGPFPGNQGADTVPCSLRSIRLRRSTVPVPCLLSFGPCGNQLPIDAATVPFVPKRVVMLVEKPEQGRPFTALQHWLRNARRDLRLSHGASAQAASARSSALKARTRSHVLRAAPALGGLPPLSQASSSAAHSQTASQLTRLPFHLAASTS